MELVVEDADVAELRALLARLVAAIETGELEASPAQLAALSGAASAVEVLQQTDV